MSDALKCDRCEKPSDIVFDDGQLCYDCFVGPSRLPLRWASSYSESTVPGEDALASLARELGATRSEIAELRSRWETTVGRVRRAVLYGGIVAVAVLAETSLGWIQSKLAPSLAALLHQVFGG